MRLKRFLYNNWYLFIAFILIIIILILPEGRSVNSHKTCCTNHDYKNKIFVYVEGETQVNGKMYFYEGSTIYNLLLAAGISDYTSDNIKLSEQLKEGNTYTIESLKDKNITISNKSTKPNTIVNIKHIENNDDSNLININEASLTILKTLPGIGDVRGKAIINYRENINKFKNKEDIKNVSGITEEIYNEIQSYITC